MESTDNTCRLTIFCPSRVRWFNLERFVFIVYLVKLYPHNTSFELDFSGRYCYFHYLSVFCLVFFIGPPKTGLIWVLPLHRPSTVITWTQYGIGMFVDVVSCVSVVYWVGSLSVLIGRKVIFSCMGNDYERV